VLKKILIGYCVAETFHAFAQSLQPKYKERLTLVGRVTKGFK